MGLSCLYPPSLDLNYLRLAVLVMEYTQCISSPLDVFGFLESFFSFFLHRKQYVILILCIYITESCSDARFPTLLPSFLLI